jgi:hypothetical protein
MTTYEVPSRSDGKRSKSQRKIYRVTINERLSRKALIRAESAQDAEDEARRLWAEGNEHNVFRFYDGGIDDIDVEEVQP